MGLVPINLEIKGENLELLYDSTADTCNRYYHAVMFFFGD